MEEETVVEEEKETDVECPECGKILSFTADVVGVFAICKNCGFYEQL